MRWKNHPLLLSSHLYILNSTYAEAYTVFNVVYGSGVCSSVPLLWAPRDQPCHPESSARSSFGNCETMAFAFSTKFCSLAAIAKEGKWTQITVLCGVFRLDETAHLNLSRHFIQSSPDEALRHSSVQRGFPGGNTSAGRDKVTNSRKSPAFHTRWLAKPFSWKWVVWSWGG